MDREAPMRAETKQMAKLFMVFIQESPSDDCTVVGLGRAQKIQCTLTHAVPQGLRC